MSLPVIWLILVTDSNSALANSLIGFWRMINRASLNVELQDHFFFYNNVVQKLKLNKIHITVTQQQYCVLTGKNYKSYTIVAKTKKIKNIKVNFEFNSF